MKLYMIVYTVNKQFTFYIMIVYTYYTVNKQITFYIMIVYTYYTRALNI